MNLLFLFSMAIILVVTATEVAAWWILRSVKDLPQPEPENWPMAAVLIAARNEADTLPACLAALEKTDYPEGRLSVWIGNDASEDETEEVAKAFCMGKKNFHIVNISHQWGQARGKANVLAQLAAKAKPVADYYIMTDADVRVPPGWIKGMLRHFKPGVALVNGTTLTEGEGWFARMQAYEWTKGQGLMKAWTSLSAEGKTLTAIGNNMVTERKAYEATGGYEKIPFSLTEDFELNRQLINLGYKSLQITTADTKVYTRHVKSPWALLQQRKRWMTGAMQLPRGVIVILFFQSLFFPAILVSLYYYPLYGLGLLTTKTLVQALLVRQMLLRLQEPPAIPFLGFELYSFVSGICQTLFYFLPFPVKWRGRRY